MLSDTTLLWPTGGNAADTYDSHDRSGRSAAILADVAIIDINQDLGEGKADYGAPVFASHDGFLKLVNSSSTNYGNQVVISENPDRSGLQTRYAHLNAFAPGIEIAKDLDNGVASSEVRVTRGQLIGYVGASGLSNDAYHLHYEVRRDNVRINLASSNLVFAKGMLEAVGSTGGVATARTGGNLLVNLKGFDWDEGVELELRAGDGTAVWGQCIVTPDKNQTAQAWIPMPSVSGDYQLYARELHTNHSSHTGQPVNVRWTSGLSESGMSLPLSIHVEGTESGQRNPSALQEGETYVTGNHGLIETFQIHVQNLGNFTIDAWDLLKQGFHGVFSLLGPGGVALAAERVPGPDGSVRVAVANAAPGDYVIGVSYNDIGTLQSGYLKWTQQATLAPDPADNTPPPRIFHDAAGGAFADAKKVAVDKSNKGDDAGQISPTDDTDLYRFTANTTGKVEIDILPKNGLTTFVTLYDAQKDANGDGKPDGVDTAASDNDDGFSHFLYDVVAGGTYYVGIASKDHASTGGYELHIRAFDPNTAPGHSGTDTTPQPMTDWGGRLKAPHINLNSENGSSCGFIGDPGETEWFEIDGAQAGNMLVTVAGVNDDLKEFVTAFRSNGGGIDSDNGEFDGTAQVGFTVSSGERIYVAVSSLEGKYTGGYTITVSQPSTLPSDDFPNFGQTPRYLDAEVTPGSSGGDGYIKGKIERTDDNDWFRIPVRGTGYMVVQVEASNGSDLTPFIELNHDGTSGGFFESDDGRDGSAQIGISPTTSDIWVKVSGVDGTQGSYTLRTWRSPNPDDDHPDSGGAYAAPLKLAEHGSVTVSGRIEYPNDKDCFRVLLNQAGPVVIEIVSLTEGFTPFLHDAWQTPNHQGDQNTDGGSGRGGRTFHIIPNIMPSPDNWVNIDISGSGAQPYGDYVLYVWQPQSAADMDSDTIGLQASPILLDGTGCGNLPGSPNGSDPTPALDYAGDKDVFQVTAAANRPITFSSNANTFLRVYDASGQSIATDHGSGPGGTSQITLEANRGQLFYLEVSAYNGTDTGAYAIHVSQPTDDHPDVPIFALKKSQTRDATVISLDSNGFGEFTGQIESTLVGDRDVFQALAAQRGQMTVSVATTDNQLDTFLRVYDSHGNLVGIDDDSGGLRNSAVTFATFQNETYQIEVSGYNDNSVGAYRVTAQTSGPASIESVGTFDNFNSGFDTSKWSLLYVNAPGSANLNVSSGRVRLEAYGTAANDNTETRLTSRSTVQNGVTWDMAGEFGIGYNFGDASVDDGAGHSITVQMNRYLPSSDNVIVVGASGYTTLQNLAPHDTTTVTFTEGTLYTFSIREEAGEIHVYMNDTLLARYAGEIASGSQFVVRARSAWAAPGRYGFLTLDNVNGNFTISDPLPAEIPATTTTTSGTYDDFQDNSLDATKWTPEVYGVTTVTETAGALQLFADGVGAATDNNVAVASSKGIIQGDVEFDLIAHLGRDVNADYVEVTDGTNHIRPVISPDGAGGLAMIVEGVGYTELENLGPRPIVDGRTYHIAFTQTDAGVGVYCDGVRIALYAGHLQINSVLGSRVESAKSAPRYAMDLYDDFNDGSINSTKWSISQDSSGQGVAETGGKMILYATANSNSRTQGVSSTSQAGGFGIHGAKWTMAYLDGGHEKMNHYAEITNGTDYIRIVSDSNWKAFWISLGGSYGSGSVKTISGPSHTIDIKEVGSDIQILFDGNSTPEYTITGKSIAANSYFHAFANHLGDNANGYGNTRLSIDDVYYYHLGATPDQDRFARLMLDNVRGTFRSTTDAIRKPYDDFTDNQVDSSKWHVVGAVEETGGNLKMPLFRSGQAVTAYADTAGIAGGTNLRGFKVHIDRTVSPKKLTGWDTLARLRLTNGNDWIEVGWNLSNNSLHIETGGGYGSMVKEITMPTDQVLDGTLEVRETNGNIEILHDGSIQAVIAGQTVRAGSYLTIQSAGNPYHQSMNNPPSDFDFSVDDISFYVAPLQPMVAITPSLKSVSDTGHSNTDHVTNSLSLDFEWSRGSLATEYQWRQGELLGDGTIQYGAWSQEQSATTAHVDLPHGSVHVFSVRPVDASGHIGTESSQALVVDTTLPSSILTFPAQGGHYNVAGWMEAISGTATDTGGAGLEKVQVSIKRNLDNKYWGETTFDQPSEFFIDVTGTGDWSVPFSAASLSTGVSYTIHSQARDLAGNAETGPTVTFTYDTTPPVVQNVLVRGTDWTTSFLDAVDSGRGLSYAIPVGNGSQLGTLPWTNIDQIKVVFSEDVVVDQGDLLLSGVTARYNVSGGTFSYDSATFTATWTLSQAIGPDKLLLQLNAGGSSPIMDRAGNRLDGEWTNPTWNVPSSPVGGDAWPSGNGVAGGDFLFRFNVLPGDASRSGTTDATDLNTVLSYYGRTGMNGSTGDFSGDGKTDATDLNTVLSYYGQGLPAAEPTASVLPGDANRDGRTDATDLNTVLSYYGQTGTSWATGDFNGDGITDATDLNTVLSYYGQSLPVSDLAMPAILTPEEPSADPVPVVTDVIVVPDTVAPTVPADETAEEPSSDPVPVVTDVTIVSAASASANIVVPDPVTPIASTDETPEESPVVPSSVVADVVISVAADEPTIVGVIDQAVPAVPVDQTAEKATVDPMSVVTDVVIVSAPDDPTDIVVLELAAPADETSEVPSADLMPIVTDVVAVSTGDAPADVAVSAPVATTGQTPEAPSADLTPVVTDVVAASTSDAPADVAVSDSAVPIVPVAETPEEPLADPVPIVTVVVVVPAFKYVDMTVDNDPAIVASAPLADTGTGAGQAACMAAVGQVPASPNVPVPTDSRPIIDRALAWWTLGDCPNFCVSKNGTVPFDATIPQLAPVQFAIREMPDIWRGEPQPSAIYHGPHVESCDRFVDPTLALARTLAFSRSDQRSRAIDSRVVDGIDLTTVAEQELGKIAGLDDLDALVENLMSSAHGRRRSRRA